MTANGYEPENAAYLDALTTVINGERIGRDPMTLDPNLLTEAGHGRRKTKAIVSALGDVSPEERITEYKDLRRHCLDCAPSVAGIRRCPIINCAAWPYRMGKNPHDPRRGKTPVNFGGGQ